MGFVEGFINAAASLLVRRRELQRERWDKKVTNRNKKDYSRQGHLPLGDKKGLVGGLPHIPLGDGKAYVTDYLIGAEKILD